MLVFSESKSVNRRQIASARFHSCIYRLDCNIDFRGAGKHIQPLEDQIDEHICLTVHATTILSQNNVFAITRLMISDFAIHCDRSLALRGPGFPAVKRSTAGRSASPREIIINPLGRKLLSNHRSLLGRPSPKDRRAHGTCGVNHLMGQVAIHTLH